MFPWRDAESLRTRHSSQWPCSIQGMLISMWPGHLSCCRWRSKDWTVAATFVTPLHGPPGEIAPDLLGTNIFHEAGISYIPGCYITFKQSHPSWMINNNDLLFTNMSSVFVIFPVLTCVMKVSGLTLQINAYNTNNLDYFRRIIQNQSMTFDIINSIE